MGLGIINWRYSEIGEFIDFGVRAGEIFTDAFVANGTETGPTSPRRNPEPRTHRQRVGFEVWFQKANADLDNRFAGSKIDLGGFTYNFTAGVRF